MAFFQNFVVDTHPQTVVTYMEPFSKPPTNNDVVQETMLRSQEVAREMKHDYAVVIYDLAIATKAYCIQALQAPRFDDVIMLLGNFHLEMAFFGAIGTYICDSGIFYLFSCIFVLLSRESDQCAIRARLGVAGHLSTTPRWGNPAKCLSQRHNK